MIGSLRQLAFAAGRVLALLAALLVALAPAIPAHAHVPGGEQVLHAHLTTAPHVHDHGSHTDSTVAADQARSDQDPPAGPHHAADCCFVCHAPVLPNAASVTLPTTALRAPRLAAEPRPLVDAPAERLPEPPRPSA